MGNVYALPTLTTLCQADAVETLERMLERAKRGEITTVAIAALTADGKGLVTYSKQINGLSLLGACNLLQHDLATALLAEGE